MIKKVFKLLKEKMISASLLTLLDFTKTFEVECNASSIGIEAFLIQEKWPKPISARSLMKQLLIIQHIIKSCMHW
jgi:uncharacterized protein YjgD (DUF1641 family)